jgi:tetratricopeptide (TPR) repeat protein
MGSRILVQALELDPGLGYALSLLALCHFEDAILGFSKDREQSLTESLRAAERAVAIDDADWLAHAVQGIAVLWRRRDFAFSLIEEERAIELNPSSTLARSAEFSEPIRARKIPSVDRAQRAAPPCAVTGPGS